MGLVRLIYVSRVGKQVRLGDAEAIAESSAVTNERHGLTGFLLYTPEYFVQVLEGEAARVEATFARIERDERHTDVQRLRFEPIEQRQFAEWSMGFAFMRQFDQSTEGRPVTEWDADALLERMLSIAR